LLEQSASLQSKGTGLPSGAIGYHGEYNTEEKIVSWCTDEARGFPLCVFKNDSKLLNCAIFWYDQWGRFQLGTPSRCSEAAQRNLDRLLAITPLKVVSM
jgi:hypothetical protein